MKTLSKLIISLYNFENFPQKVFYFAFCRNKTGRAYPINRLENMLDLGFIKYLFGVFIIIAQSFCSIGYMSF